MKKVKFFISFLRERDWLEEMATQGWLLTDIKLGAIYYFKEITPCEKVYELERFAISSNPTISDLTARSNAIELAKEFGWEVVTHDEDMNYYFVKDKAGDETDEFYLDEESRKARAERYRNRYCIEQPHTFAKSDIVFSVFYLLLITFLSIVCLKSNRVAAMGDGKSDYVIATLFPLLAIYAVNALITTIVNLYSIKWGNLWYKELCMTREEWEYYKKYSEKKSFSNIQQLRAYLQEKSEFGLSLVAYENGTFHFEEDTKRYNYYIDTKKALKRRMKKAGTQFKADNKDWYSASPKWYEASIADAAQYGLKPVAVLYKHVLVYKRPYSDDHKANPLPWENGGERIQKHTFITKVALFMIICFAIGFLVGFVGAHISNL